MNNSKPSGGAGSADYHAKRQKNNEAAKNSRIKKKGIELEMADKKQKLEMAYVQLQRQIDRMRSTVRA